MIHMKKLHDKLKPEVYLSKPKYSRFQAYNPVLKHIPSTVEMIHMLKLHVEVKSAIYFNL